jgi:hypothetical protein
MQDKKTVLLKNGNPQGDPNGAPRCGAQTRDNTECRGPAMKNGRCRLHGGKSTGPRTPEGLERSRKANLKHGLYSKGFIKEKNQIGAITKVVNEMAKCKIENPIVLDGFARYFVKLETLDTEPTFLESIDFEKFDKLDKADQLKLYKEATRLLNRSAKSSSKFLTKIERLRKKTS